MRREEANLDGGRRGRPEERGDRRVETATERGNQIFRGLQRDPGRESKRRYSGILISIDAGK